MDIDIYEVVKKLVGEIQPVGETNTDNNRYENLKNMAGLVDKLVTDIDAVAFDNRDRLEFSVKRASEFADMFLSNNLSIKE